jgi:hypothetical protein
MHEKLASYGIWTYRGAWVLELTAAAIGLATGLALGLQAIRAGGEFDAMNLVLASAPFFMVAFAELTKIPIATLLFSVSWVWKPIVLVFLIALAAITFETVFMGLERATTLRQLQYQDLREEIAKLAAEDQRLRQATADAQATDEVANATEKLTSLSAAAEADRVRLQDQISAIDTQVAGERALPPEAALVRETLAEAKADRAALVAEQTSEMDKAVAEFQSQRQVFDDRMRLYYDQGETEKAQAVEEQLARLANPRPRLEAEHRKALLPKDELIAERQKRLDELAAQATPMSQVQLTSLQNRKADLQAQLDAKAADWEEQLATAREALKQAQTTSAAEGTRVADYQARLDAIGAQTSTLEGRRIELARTDQVRRLAGRFFGVEPEAVNEEQAGLIALLWFGSLAALAALAGPMTAIVALALQRIGASQRPPPSALSRTLRRLIVNWRWRRVRSVTVPIEVQVPTEVERRVEVPVEVMVKEILYVPILTDDPELVMQALQQKLPPEVSTLVKTSTARRGKRADKAQHDAA